VALTVLVTGVINLLIAMVSFKYLLKPILIILLLTSATASYFMQQYGVMLDVTMLQNIIETNPGEAMELIGPAMYWHIMAFGVVPALILARTKIVYKSLPIEILARAGNILIITCVIGLTLFAFYKEFASFGRNNNTLSSLINPLNYINALRRYGEQNMVREQPVKEIGTDAYLLTQSPRRQKNNLTILVVGETARASSYSLNGYAHNTNPNLAKQDIINYSNTWSCGTATAISLPCMFSNIGRDNYSDNTAKHQQNLLDVLQHAGVQVLWRDNNSGCKGVCARVETQEMTNIHGPQYCVDGECYDEILLSNLQQYIDNLNRDAVIVLHLQGSHGPSYHLRYPKRFAVFKPFCDSNQLEDCTREEVVNVYDNTILYTDHVLNEVIELLKLNSTQLNTAMLYMSDHGESLGENGVYLHGLPYFMAPDHQKHIPFIVWLSDQYSYDAGIDKACLKTGAKERYSHDNLFHSMLGLMGVNSGIYKPELDVLQPCRKNKVSIEIGTI
jgi:lipid A ethanolaminephosphotransferase